MLNGVLYAALRLATWLLPAIPERAAYRLADAAGTVSYYLFPIARGAILANLEIAFPDRSPRAREHLARSAFRSDARNWLDTLRIPRLTNEEILQRVQVDGLEYLHQVAAEGHGAVLVSLHLGNFDLVGQYIAALDYRLTVPVERMNPERLFLFLKQQRESKGIRLVTPDQAPRAMLQSLHSGELVGMAVDRHLTGKGVNVRQFGRTTMFVRSPAALALSTGAPVLVAIGIRIVDGSFQGFISAPIRPPGEGPRPDKERFISQEIASVLEAFIRRYPEQWLAFTPLWAQNAPLNHAATIEQQKEAAI